MSKIVVLGASGMLGHKISQQLAAKGHEVIGTVRVLPAADAPLRSVLAAVRLVEHIRAQNFDTIDSLLRGEKPDAVVNCIGLIKQHDRSENRLRAVAINSYLPHQLEHACGSLGARLVHFSTDCVFSGRRGQYREGDLADGEDVYGRSKYLGETADTQQDALTLRSSIVGRELSGTAHGLVEWFLSQEGKRIKGFAKAIYTGFTTIEMARIVDLVVTRDEPLRGVYHVASSPISKYDLLGLIRQATGANIEIDRDESFVCDRSLVMDRFGAETGYIAPAWKHMIEEMAIDSTPYRRYGVN